MYNLEATHFTYCLLVLGWMLQSFLTWNEGELIEPNLNLLPLCYQKKKIVIVAESWQQFLERQFRKIQQSLFPREFDKVTFPTPSRGSYFCHPDNGIFMSIQQWCIPTDPIVVHSHLPFHPSSSSWPLKSIFLVCQFEVSVKV